MNKQMTSDQRMNLAFKMFHYFLSFVVTGFLIATIGGGMGYKYLLMCGIFLAVIGFVFFVVSMKVRYYETKLDWQQETKKTKGEKLI